MKDKESKPLIKSARKTARTAIHLRIVSELKLIAKEFGQDSEELIQDMEKGAKKLAKKISEQLKITLPADTTAPKENKAVKTAVKPKPVLKEKAVAKSKPAVSAKKAVPAVKAVSVPAKKVTTKTVAAKPVKTEKPVVSKAKPSTKKS